MRCQCLAQPMKLPIADHLTVGQVVRQTIQHCLTDRVQTSWSNRRGCLSTDVRSPGSPIRTQRLPHNGQCSDPSTASFETLAPSNPLQSFANCTWRGLASNTAEACLLQLWSQETRCFIDLAPSLKSSQSPRPVQSFVWPKQPRAGLWHQGYRWAPCCG